jgi:rhodanese-related sulfurtransferase
MARKSRLALSLVLILTVAAGPLMAADGSYGYISPSDLEARIRSGSPLLILDIQVEEEFSRHHIKGAVATFAYPVKSGEEKSRVSALLDRINGGTEPVVIVCPRGGGGAKRTYDHLLKEGIRKERLLILEKGQSGWPYPELLEGEAGQL